VARRGPLRRTLATLAALFIAALAAGCVSMPTGGPVQSYPVTQGTGAPNQPNVQFQPQKPGDGWSPQQIVQGFLAASASFGNYSRVALQYLTPQAQKVWNYPTWSAVIYKEGPDAADPVYPTAAKNAENEKNAKTATVQVTGTIQATLKGSTYSVPSTSATRSSSDAPPPFKLAKGADGQWRISFAPEEILLTSGSFANDYQLRNLYFFDPTGRYLVPDPIYVPLRAPGDLLNGLVQDLITPPDDWLSGGATKTALPAGTKLSGVTVVDSVTALVNLTGSIAKDGGNAALMEQVSTQLLWTLSGSRQNGSTGAVQSVEVKLNGHPWFPPDSPGNPVQQKSQSKTAPPTGANSVYYYVDSAGYLTSRQGTGGKPQRVQLLGTGYTQVAVSPSGKYVAALRGTALYTGLLGDALEKRGSGYATMSWDGSDNLWTAQGGQVFMYRVTVTVRNRIGQLNPVPVTVNNPPAKDVGIAFTALRVAPDGVRVALVIENGELTFGAISGQQGQNPQITLSEVKLTPPSTATTFSGLTWYGPDNVITLAQPGPAATEYPVSGGYSTQIPVEPGMKTITASLGNLLIAGLTDRTIVADNSLTGAWMSLGNGVAPAYPG
jgi:Lipoprotein LpqB beta-propeller domain/Sporulation and spore germination